MFQVTFVRPYACYFKCIHANTHAGYMQVVKTLNVKSRPLLAFILNIAPSKRMGYKRLSAAVGSVYCVNVKVSVGDATVRVKYSAP